MTEETKVCSKCKMEKNISLFNKDKSNKDGIRCKCRNCTRKEAKDYCERNKELIKQRNAKRKYYPKNIKNRIINTAKDYYKKHVRTKKGENLYLSMIIRGRINTAIKKHFGSKAYKTIELLDCSIDECRKWLESKFLPGMTWDNHGLGEGKWHIDHIIPCARFDLTKPEEQKKCFHYTNLQPLWAEENLCKSDKIQVLTSEGLFLV